MQIDVGSSFLNCFVQLHVKHTITEGTQHKDTVHILINQGVSSPPCPASSFWFPVPVLLCTKQCELKLKQHHFSVTSHVKLPYSFQSLHLGAWRWAHSGMKIIQLDGSSLCSTFSSPKPLPMIGWFWTIDILIESMQCAQWDKCPHADFLTAVLPQAYHWVAA